MTPPADDDRRIVDIVLDDPGAVRWSPELEHERRVAIFDLLEDNRFEPEGEAPGPYALRLSVAESRLEILILAARGGAEIDRVALSLTGLRRVVKDYFTVCENYFEAIRAAPPSRIEALDMGRRAVHDEGARLIAERLAGRARIDDVTARRLFTLICALHPRR